MAKVRLVVTLCPERCHVHHKPDMINRGRGEADRSVMPLSCDHAEGLRAMQNACAMRLGSRPSTASRDNRTVIVASDIVFTLDRVAAQRIAHCRSS